MRFLLFSVLQLACILAICQNIDMPTVPANGIGFTFEQIEGDAEPIKYDYNGPWDFSKVMTSKTYEMKLLPLDSSSSKSNYPKATHLIKSDNGEFFYTYQNNQIVNYGRITENVEASYTNGVRWMQFPLNASSYSIDSINSTFLFMGFEAPLADKWESISLGSSTLILPDGTKYDNAVLVQSIKTMFGGPLGPLTVTYVEEGKYWWVPEIPLPVVAFEKFYTNSSLQYQRSSFLRNEGTSKINQVRKSKINAYPNPATDKLSIELRSASTISIFRMDGSLMFTMQSDRGTQAISVKDFPKGNYVLLVIDNTSAQHQVFIKK